MKERWEKIPVAIVADMVTGSLIDPAIRPLRQIGTQPKMFGFALPVTCEGGDISGLVMALDEIEPGHVLVIAAEGRTDMGMIGGILSGHARSRGAVGVICDGAVRDIKEIISWDNFAVYARGVCARGPAFGNRGKFNLAVTIGGKCIAPGDLIIGDDDGIAVLRPEQLEGAIDAVEGKLAKEEVWIQRLADGHTAKQTFELAK